MSERPTYGYSYGEGDPQPSGPSASDPGEPRLSASGPSTAGAGSYGQSQSQTGTGAYGQNPTESSDSGRTVPYGIPGDPHAVPTGGSIGGGAGEPVCPRHPDRPSYVRCKRCQRPACGECQRQAPVGMLCVDCERELQQQSQNSQPRTAMGGRMGAAQPVVTWTILGLCVLLYGGQVIAPQIVEQLLMFAPVRALSMPWTFLTSGFLHGGIIHLAVNMYALWIIGRHLERTLGHWRYAGIFLTSVLAGHVAVLLLSSPASESWYTGTVGASGGLFGLFGALFIVSRRMGGDVTQILILIGLNVVLTFTIPGISWQGHLGGLVMGTALAAAMFALRPKATAGADRAALAKRSAMIHGGVIAAGVVVCLVLIAVKVMLVS